MTYLVEELSHKPNCNVFVLCAKGGEVAQWCKHNNITVFEEKEVFAVNPVFASRVSQVCKENAIDLIHVHDSHAHTFAVMANALFGAKTPLIVSRRVDFSVKKSWLSRYKYNHKSVKRILCVSDTIKAITAPAIQHKEVLATVYSGINLSRFDGAEKNGTLNREFQIDPSFPLVGNVAALAPHKDYKTFIDTCVLLVKQGLKAKFFIIGAGPMEEEVKQWVKASGIEEHIIMTGFRKDIPQILPELDVFLITSETEGLGTSILDAFACKVPVVATDAGGIPEIVNHNKTGYLGKVKAPELLAEGVTKMLSDKPYAQEMVKGASEKLTHFTKKAMAEKTFEHYQSVISELHSGSLQS